MTQFYRYRSTFGVSLWIEDLGNDAVRLGGLEVTELAEHLQAGQSTIILDDPDADLGHSGDHILGLQRFDIIEDDEDTDNQRLYFGFTTVRTYTRGDSERSSLRVAANRQIAISLVDLNCIPTFVMFPNDDADADRPAETVDARIAWLFATPYFVGNVYDEGLVESNTTLLSATNYQGQTAANVISDCETQGGFGWNAWIYFDEPTQHHALGFLNANTSTLYSSTLRISNDLADIDTGTVETFTTGTTFAPNHDAALIRDPKDITSGIYLAWNDGTVYRERAATKTIYGRRDLAAPSTNIRTAAKAIEVANDYLFQSSTDDDNISVKIEVPTSKVNHIKAGMRLEVKFTHLPGYESFTWCRVIRRTVIQEQATDRYIIDMDLSPQEAGAPAPGSCVDLYENTPSGTYYPLGGESGPSTGGFAAPSDGVVYYFRSGVSLPTVPTPGTACIWHFPSYGVGGAGSSDFAGSCVQNKLIFMTVGNGTWTIQTEAGGTARGLTVSKGPYGDIEGTPVASISPGDSIEVEIDDATDGDCIRFVQITDTFGTCGSYWGWSEAVWVAA